MTDAVLYEQEGGIVTLTLNRPEARNALSGEMLSIMVDAWNRVDDDPEIRTCILTGAGGYFCAGMDLKAASAKPPAARRARSCTSAHVCRTGSCGSPVTIPLALL